MSLDRIRKSFDAGDLTANPLDDGSGVLVDTAGERLVTLNATGMTLAGAIEQGVDSESGLAEALTAEFEVSHERALADARDFVARLSEALD